MKCFTFRKHEAGFTLIELLVAITLTVIAGGLVLGIFVQSNKTFSIQNNKVNQSLALADSNKAINDLVRIASSVVSQYTVGATTYTSGLNTLVLTLPAINASGNNIVGVFDYAVITEDQTSNKILRLTTFPSASSIRKSQSRVLATNLSKINFFYYDNNGNVVAPASATRVNITLNTSEPSAYSSISSSSSDINLRNN